MKVSIIVAIAENGVIGRAGKLPWHLSADLRRFKRLTMGHSLIMGRKTYESIGRPLPGRTSVVVTRQSQYQPAGVRVVPCLERGLEIVSEHEQAFIVGGSQIYGPALEIADRLYVTRVHANVEGDVSFPALDAAEWRMCEETPHPRDEEHAYAFTFQVYDRVEGTEP